MTTQLLKVAFQKNFKGWDGLVVTFTLPDKTTSELIVYLKFSYSLWVGLYENTWEVSKAFEFIVFRVK